MPKAHAFFATIVGTVFLMTLWVGSAAAVTSTVAGPEGNDPSATMAEFTANAPLNTPVPQDELPWTRHKSEFPWTLIGE